MDILAVPVAASLLVAASAVVQHLNTVLTKGPGFVLTDRSTALPSEGFSGRTARTLQNNLESLAMSAPIALALSIMQLDTPLMVAAGLIYIAARTGFTLSYWIGASFFRSLFWAVGMAAIGVMAWGAIPALTPR